MKPGRNRFETPERLEPHVDPRARRTAPISLNPPRLVSAPKTTAPPLERCCTDLRSIGLSGSPNERRICRNGLLRGRAQVPQTIHGLLLM